MYCIRPLPLLPAETRAGYVASAPCEFVDPASAEVVVNAWTSPIFRNQTYHGEDFAGRDDVSSVLSTSLFLHRTQVGPFFLKVPEQGENQVATGRIDTPPSSVDQRSSNGLNRRYRVAVAAVLVGVSLTFVGYLTDILPPILTATPSQHSASDRQEPRAEGQVMSRQLLSSNGKENKERVMSHR